MLNADCWSLNGHAIVAQWPKNQPFITARTIIMCKLLESSTHTMRFSLERQWYKQTKNLQPSFCTSRWWKLTGKLQSLATPRPMKVVILVATLVTAIFFVVVAPKLIVIGWALVNSSFAIGWTLVNSSCARTSCDDCCARVAQRENHTMCSGSLSLGLVLHHI